MAHEQVLKAFYARLKGVASDSLTRMIDLGKEYGLSYRQLRELVRHHGLEVFWIGGKAFVCKQEAVNVILRAS
ncbi:MAG TPA: hypothetical protein VFV52_15660 [Bacilli bacterium]|nr:hypothetical protein [Bacilli bacterium]